ncbi:MAG: phosphoglycerate mutase family protein [Actinomycetota bacterium]|nr:phosphoglycerate mutase family protein [Actinomycetota bacterium]
MSLLLIRHGSAGDPYQWVGEDVDRPLDARGAAQAGRLADLVSTLFADRSPTRILSSRAVRCLQTVGPLCTRLGIRPEVVDYLFEGASRNTTTRIRDLATDPETSPVVLCSHSDVIHDVVRDLVSDGAGISGGRECGYASIWELTIDGSRIAHARYHPTP